jgi:hypothetical protein
MADIAAAAAAAGVTPTGFCAEAALAAARGTAPASLDPDREGLARLQAELFARGSRSGASAPTSTRRWRH